MTTTYPPQQYSLLPVMADLRDEPPAVAEYAVNHHRDAITHYSDVLSGADQFPQSD